MLRSQGRHTRAEQQVTKGSGITSLPQDPWGEDRKTMLLGVMHLPLGCQDSSWWMRWFPIAAWEITTTQALKQHKIILQFQRSEVWNRFAGLKSRCWHGCVPLRILKENLCPWLFQLLEIVYISWLVATSFRLCFLHHLFYSVWPSCLPFTRILIITLDDPE